VVAGIGAISRAEVNVIEEEFIPGARNQVSIEDAKATGRLVICQSPASECDIARSHGEDDFVIYTDGGCRGDCGAFARVVFRRGETSACDAIAAPTLLAADSFTAEGCGLVEGLSWVDREVESGSVSCFVDTLSNLAKLSGPFCDDLRQQHLRLLINRITSRGIGLALNFTYGHEDSVGNHIADGVVDLAWANGEVAESSLVYTVRAAKRKVLRKLKAVGLHSLGSLCSRSRSLNLLRDQTAFSRNPVLRPSSGCLAPRLVEVAYSQLRVGDMTFVQGFSKHVEGMWGVRRCVCSSLLTPRHFLFECPRYDEPRGEFQAGVLRSAGVIREMNQEQRDRCSGNEQNQLRLRREPVWGSVELVSLLPGCVMQFIANCEVWILKGPSTP
jgi:hypothetical protein